jgi:hypothetical protein
MDSNKESEIIKQTLKELMERWKNSRPKIIQLILYARNSKQYILSALLNIPQGMRRVFILKIKSLLVVMNLTTLTLI